MSAAALQISPAEYPARERNAMTRSEYASGRMRPRHGSNRRHSLIVGRLVALLNTRLAGRPFEGYVNDMRVRTPDGPYYYPDAVVAPSPPLMEDADQDTLLNPIIVIEVLSPSTEAIDRGEKLDNYRLIPSLSNYLIVFQDRKRVEHYSRISADEWRLVTCETEDAVPLPALGVHLPLADLYGNWLAD